MNFLKRWVAGNELKKLERYELAMQLAQRWMASWPQASAALTYVADVVEDRESPNTISDLQHALLSEVGRLAEKLNEREKFEDELNALHAKYAHMRLRADLGWKRYDEANAKYKVAEHALEVTNKQLEEYKSYGFQWYAALVKCAIYLGIPVGHSITEAAPRLKSYIKNRRFVFINDPKEDAGIPFDKTAMTKAIETGHQPEYLMPGIPCSGCQENCCVPTNKGCAIVQMRSPI